MTSKKNFYFVLSLSIALVCFIMFPFANTTANGAEIIDSGECGDGVYWSIDDEWTLTVSGSGSMTSHPWYNTMSLNTADYRDGVRKIVIEDGVTSIANASFHGFENLETVIMSDSVTTIGNQAFLSCHSLSDLTLSSQIQSIGDSAFEDCTNLATLIDLSSTTDIGCSAFKNCKSLIGVVFSDELTTINLKTFNGCSELSIISLPKNISYIGVSAFGDCTSLTTIYLPPTLAEVDNYAFSGCTGLTDVIISGSITNMGDSVFENCSSIVNLTIEEGISEISSGTFSGCTSLESVVIPSGVGIIDYKSFEGCTSLSSITIPTGVMTIGSRAFRDCDNLKDIYYTGSEDRFSTILIEDSNSSLESATLHCDSIISDVYNTDTVAKELVESGQCGDKAYWGLYDNGLLIIKGSGEISDCSWNSENLKSVNIQGNITNIPDNAFSQCTNLESVIFPDTLAEIGSGAFDGCVSLQSLTIPSSVKTIGSNALNNCTSLESITYLGTEEKYNTISIVPPTGVLENIQVNFAKSPNSDGEQTVSPETLDILEKIQANFTESSNLDEGATTSSETYPYWMSILEVIVGIVLIVLMFRSFKLISKWKTTKHDNIIWEHKFADMKSSFISLFALFLYILAATNYGNAIVLFMLSMPNINDGSLNNRIQFLLVALALLIIEILIECLVVKSTKKIPVRSSESKTDYTSKKNFGFGASEKDNDFKRERARSFLHNNLFAKWDYITYCNGEIIYNAENGWSVRDLLISITEFTGEGPYSEYVKRRIEESRNQIRENYIPKDENGKADKRVSLSKCEKTSLCWPSNWEHPLILNPNDSAIEDIVCLRNVGIGRKHTIEIDGDCGIIRCNSYRTYYKELFYDYIETVSLGLDVLESIQSKLESFDPHNCKNNHIRNIQYNLKCMTEICKWCNDTSKMISSKQAATRKLINKIENCKARMNEDTIVDWRFDNTNEDNITGKFTEINPIKGYFYRAEYILGEANTLVNYLKEECMKLRADTEYIATAIKSIRKQRKVWNVYEASSMSEYVDIDIKIDGYEVSDDEQEEINEHDKFMSEKTKQYETYPFYNNLSCRALIEEYKDRLAQSERNSLIAAKAVSDWFPKDETSEPKKIMGKDTVKEAIKVHKKSFVAADNCRNLKITCGQIADEVERHKITASFDQYEECNNLIRVYKREQNRLNEIQCKLNNNTGSLRELIGTEETIGRDYVKGVNERAKERAERA